MKKISIARTGLTITSLAGLVSILALLVWWQQEQLGSTDIIFLNVGQGDAILIEQGRNQILIDSGRESHQLASELGRYMPFWDRHIEMIVPTHPDADHIGGFAGLTKQYSIGRILWTGVESKTDVFLRLQKVLSAEVPGERWHKVAAGTKITLPQGGTIEMLFPYQIMSGLAKDEDTNATSIVLRFQYGDTSFLLTGDLPKEETVLREVEPVTVLKAAHHGSKYSSSESFLKMIQPKEAILSVGKNSYGHPSPEVVDRLEKMHINILRTDQMGSIRYHCSLVENSCSYVGPRRF